MLRLPLLLFFMLTFAPLAGPAHAQAGPATASLRVEVIVASAEEGQVDAALRDLQRRLQTQFSQFRSFVLRSRETWTLQAGQSASLPLLPNVNATFRLLSVNGERAEVEVTVPGGQTTVALPPSGLVFVAGPRDAEGRTLILALRRVE